MIILTNFCDGTTFYRLWDHKILFKGDDWILHCLEVDQGLKISHIFAHNQSIFLSVNIEHRWRKWQRHSLKSVKSLGRTWSQTWIFCIYAECYKWLRWCVLKIDSTLRRMCNHCVKIHFVHVMFLSLFPRAAVWFGHQTVVCQGQRSTH